MEDGSGINDRDHRAVGDVPEGRLLAPSNSAMASPPTLELPPILTPPELAKLLRLRPRSVYDAIRRREIPGVQRIGRKVRIHRDTIIRWLADGQGRVSRSPRRTE